MLKKYIRTICASLVAMGAIFFVGSAYSVGSSVVVGQPQLDTTATAGNATAITAVATTSVPSQQTAQMNTSSSGAMKKMPTSANGQAVESEIFQGEAVTK